jgi:hypothetical protein
MPNMSQHPYNIVPIKRENFEGQRKKNEENVTNQDSQKRRLAISTQPAASPPRSLRHFGQAASKAAGRRSKLNFSSRNS